MKKNNFKNILKIFVIFALVILTFYRICLAFKIPLYAQAGADLDDFMMVKYAIKLIDFKWLGAFDYLVLAKSCSFSLFLAISYWLNIPYSIMLISVYIIAIIILLFAINKIINNKVFCTISYVILLYTPVMFHIENFQKIYRGGTIISFAILVVASFIGLYASRNEKLKKLCFWSILGSLSLGFFWFIKEDSIWILPFVLGAITLSIVWLLINKKNITNIKTRILLLIFPICFLILINIGYKSINYFIYGEYTVTDRSGTYYKEVLNDLLKIKNSRKENVWITKKTVYDAMEVSPTFKTIKPQIDEMYKNSWALIDGEVRGDIIFWTLRIAFFEAGIYDNGGSQVNEFYKKIDKELDNAFENKKLKEENAFYLSKASKGITKQDLNYFKKESWNLLKVLITFSENEISYNEANGNFDDIIVMQQVTNSHFAWPNTGNTITNLKMKERDLNYINKANKIVNIYQKLGLIIFFISILGMILLFIKTIINLFKKKYDNLSISLISLGLIITCIVLFVGVEWFVSWFGFTKYRYMYNYCCGIIVLIQFIELIGVYSLIYNIYLLAKTLIKKKILKK